MAPKKPKNPPTLLLIQRNFLRLNAGQNRLPATAISVSVAGLSLSWTAIYFGNNPFLRARITLRFNATPSVLSTRYTELSQDPLSANQTLL